MNYLNNDELERYWFKYKSEAEPHDMSLERFCEEADKILLPLRITNFQLRIIPSGSGIDEKVHQLPDGV